MAPAVCRAFSSLRSANGALLVHQAEGDDFWTLPGGRTEIGEPAEETLRREMKEELGTEAEVLRPLWFVENFFNYDSKDYHEVALYFLMRFRDPGPVLGTNGPMIGLDDGLRLIFRRVLAHARSLAALPLLPSFLPTAVENLPLSLQHFVHRD